VSRAKNLLLYVSLCEKGHLYFFYCVSTAGITSRQGNVPNFLFKRGITQPMAEAGHVTATTIRKKITGAREVRLKFKKKIISSMFIFTCVLSCSSRNV